MFILRRFEWGSAGYRISYRGGGVVNLSREGVDYDDDDDDKAHALEVYDAVDQRLRGSSFHGLIIGLHAHYIFNLLEATVCLSLAYRYLHPSVVVGSAGRLRGSRHPPCWPSRLVFACPQVPEGFRAVYHKRVIARPDGLLVMIRYHADTSNLSRVCQINEGR
jgi:hypothetical protein